MSKFGQLDQILGLDLEGGDVGMFEVCGEVGIAGEAEVLELLLFEEAAELGAGGFVLIKDRNVGALGGEHDSAEA